MICKDYKNKRLGYFNDKQDAVRAYNAAATLLHGEFAFINVGAQDPVIAE